MTWSGGWNRRPRQAVLQTACRLWHLRRGVRLGHGPVVQPGTGNPTRSALEQLIARLEGGTRGLAFASGMAAMSTVLMLFNAGDHLVVSDDVYGGTFRVLDGVFSRLGLEVM